MIAAALIGYLVSRGEGGSPSAGENTGTTTEPAQTTDAATTEPADTTSEEPPTTTEAETTTTTTTTSEPPAEVGPDKALTDYYGLLPNDLETAYSRLTDRFKAQRAPSFDAYRGWWEQMSAVNVNNVQVVGPDQVSASVSYSFKSGRNEVEQHVYTLVKVDGQWAIDGQQ